MTARLHAEILDVMISTPGDTAAEVEAITKLIHNWNGSSRSRRESVKFEALHWSRNSVPRMHEGGGQAVLNEQLVDRAKILIVIFDSRLGTPTDSAPSGTVEELELAHSAGKLVHVYFSREDLPHNIDEKELSRLRKFKKSLRKRGLCAEYSNLPDLVDQVREALEDDLNILIPRTTPVTAQPTSRDAGPTPSGHPASAPPPIQRWAAAPTPPQRTHRDDAFLQLLQHQPPAAQINVYRHGRGDFQEPAFLLDIVNDPNGSYVIVKYTDSDEVDKLPLGLVGDVHNPAMNPPLTANDQRLKQILSDIANTQSNVTISLIEPNGNGTTKKNGTFLRFTSVTSTILGMSVPSPLLLRIRMTGSGIEETISLEQITSIQIP